MKNSTVYRAVHDKVRRERGPASSHACRCGAQAEEWSLNSSTAIGDLHVVRHNDQAMWFSTLTADYSARCVPCHRRADAEVRRLEEEAIEAALHPDIYASL